MTVTRRVVVYTGFALGALVLLVAVIVGLLFLAPDLNLFGVTSVSARNQYTTYYAADNSDIADILASRNIIIESQNIDVEVRVRKAGQESAGSIQIWENSSGLSFNNIKRTHIDWMQEIIEVEQADGTFRGEVFWKITIIEPDGIVSRNGYVYINMYPTDENGGSQTGYNFILNTHKSNVVFASDDDSMLFKNPLYIDTLKVEDASGKIYLPPAPADTNSQSFYVNVGNLVVKNSTANIDCRSAITKNVEIECDRGNFSFGDIGGNIKVAGQSNSVSVDKVGGNVILSGDSVSFYQRTGAIQGYVDYRADSGRLSIMKCDYLFVETKNSLVNVSTMCNKVDFISTETGSITIMQISSAERAGNADYAKIKAQSGKIELYKVWCNVDIDNKYGATRVSFDSNIDLGSTIFPMLILKAYDGTVDLSNICGEIDVFITAGGKSYVNADFRQVYGRSRIHYDGSTRPNQSAGTINVTFIRTIKPCYIDITATASARNYTTLLHDNLYNEISSNGASLENNSWYYVNYAGGVGSAHLEVITSNILKIYSRS